MTIGAVVLAAGQGTRMTLGPAQGGPPDRRAAMINWVIDALAAAGVGSTVVVVGHGADAVRDVLPAGVAVAVQERQLGTGDAARVGSPGWTAVRHRRDGLRRHAAAAVGADRADGPGARLRARATSRCCRRWWTMPVRTGAWCAAATARWRRWSRRATPPPRSSRSASTTPASTLRPGGARGGPRRPRHLQRPGGAVPDRRPRGGAREGRGDRGRRPRGGRGRQRPR